MARGAEILGPADIAISEATADAVHAAGRQVYVSRMLERSQSTVAQWGNSEVAEFIPLRLVPVVENMSAGQDGWPHITRALAKMQGFELFRLPAPEGEAMDWLAQGRIPLAGLVHVALPEDPAQLYADIMARRIAAPFIVLDWTAQG